METLHYISIRNYVTKIGKTSSVSLSYQLFGKKLHTAPIVLVNHALTGNSNVAGKDGWWNALIGKDKVIDTHKYTIIAFNIPGNGYDDKSENLIENYKDFVARDIAELFLLGLEKLKINKLFAVIGGSLGGGIAWEMAVINPIVTEHLIVVASDWKSTDWLIANCQIQEQFLLNSSNPVHDARMHAMLCYRTPESFKPSILTFAIKDAASRTSLYINPWYPAEGSVNSGNLPLVQSKVPASIIAPPKAVPLPLIYFVNE